jgi:hypothetical protein
MIDAIVVVWFWVVVEISKKEKKKKWESSFEFRRVPMPPGSPVTGAGYFGRTERSALQLLRSP